MLNFHYNAAPNPMKVAFLLKTPGLPHGAENDNEAKRVLSPSNEWLTK